LKGPSLACTFLRRFIHFIFVRILFLSDYTFMDKMIGFSMLSDFLSILVRSFL